MALEEYFRILLPAIEKELKRAIATVDRPNLKDLWEMQAYHMGWQGIENNTGSGRKRIRPLLVLLVNEASGGEWKHALPAAAAVELVHNFSLIHDDIQDNSPLRRGRMTVWKRWGIPQAINTGDTMFTLAHLTMLHLAEFVPANITLQAVGLLQEACLELTKGQFLDLSFESREEITINEYWSMIEGKTAKLISTCTELGALIGQADNKVRQAYREFGRFLGLAFQVQDDYLGIWGEAERTGKSTASDLLSGKKSLPVLFGLTQKGKFAKRWKKGNILQEEVPDLANQLAIEGGQDFTTQRVNEYILSAKLTLQAARPQGEAGKALIELSEQLLDRKS